MVNATTGAATSGLTFSAGDIKVSVDDAALIDAIGDVTDIGNGLYLYELVETPSIALTLNVQKASYCPYDARLTVPVVPDFSLTDDVAARHVALFLTDKTTGLGVTATPSLADIYTWNETSLAFTSGVGAIDVVGRGNFVFHPPDSVLASGLVIVRAFNATDYDEYVASIRVGTRPGSVISLGSFTGRWGAIQARVAIPDNDKLILTYTLDDIAQEIYDGTTFNPFFVDRSSVVASDTSGEYVVTLLPNGGWQRSSFTLGFTFGDRVTTEFTL